MMAFYSGRDGVIKVGPTPTQVGELQRWTLDYAASVQPGWGMGDTATRHHLNAPPAGSGSFEVYLDPADDGQALLVEGATLALELYPGGETVGTGYFTLSAIIESRGRTAEKDGIPMMTVNFKVDGAITDATVAP